MADTLIIAKEIIVGSEAGQHGRLSPSSLIFFGLGGKVKFGVWATNEGTTLSLRDGNGRERIRLTVDDEGAPEIALARCGFICSPVRERPQRCWPFLRAVPCSNGADS